MHLFLYSSNHHWPSSGGTGAGNTQHQRQGPCLCSNSVHVTARLELENETGWLKSKCWPKEPAAAPRGKEHGPRPALFSPATIPLGFPLLGATVCVQDSRTVFLVLDRLYPGFKNRSQGGEGRGLFLPPTASVPVCWKQGSLYEASPDRSAGLAVHAEPINTVSLDFNNILNGFPLKQSLRNLENMAQGESSIKQDVGEISSII